jgi:hypothetical protein
VLCVILVSAFHLVTIRDGQDWGDDFSQYIHHAENLARGQPYAETGYIYNPHNPAVGPRAYPPGFPVLLAPIVSVFGRALRPMQVFIVATLAASLLLVLRLFGGVLPSPYLEALVLLVGLSPVVWEFKDLVLSDLPFLCFVAASLACFSQLRRPGVSGGLAGLLAYAAYTTRVLGAVLVPTFLAHELLRYRRIGVRAAAACGVLVVLAAAQHLMWRGGEGSYFDQLAVTPAVLGRNLIAYTRSLSDLWANGYVEAARKALFLAATGLAVWGYAKAVRAGAAWPEVFPLLYLTPVILWPSYQGVRFLIPVSPFYFFYCLEGSRQLDAAIHRRWGRQRVAFKGLLVAAAVTYGCQYSTVRFGSFPTGVARPESVEFFDFVKSATDSNAVVVFSKPRALALYTGRRASAPYSPRDPCDLWRYFAEIGASYVATGPHEPHVDVAYLDRFVDRYRADLRPVWQGRDLAVYRIERNPCEPPTGSDQRGSGSSRIQMFR